LAAGLGDGRGELAASPERASSRPDDARAERHGPSSSFVVAHGGRSQSATSHDADADPDVLEALLAAHRGSPFFRGTKNELPVPNSTASVDASGAEPSLS
jgi:hypothetical protein